MASEKKRIKMKKYMEEVSFQKSSKMSGPIKMKDVCTSFLMDNKRLVSDIVDVSSSPVVSTNKIIANSFDIIKSMKQDLKNAAWVLSGKITQLKFMPSQNIRMLVSGNVFGNIGFWNMDHKEDDKNNNGIYVYYAHPTHITGIAINPFSLSKIMSSCYNGRVRVLDVENESFGLAYESKHLISCICSSENINTLFFGEAHGDVTSLDLRSSQPTLSCSLHTDKTYTIDFNPQNSNIMATSSKDGTACIWDLRKLDSKPKPLKVIQHEKRVNSAYFSPSGIYLATTSDDNCIGLVNATHNYDLECMLHHFNKTWRFTSPIRGIWGWDDCNIMVANKDKKGVDIVSINENRPSYTLGSIYINAIPCCLDAHPMKPGLLAGSTAGGRVYVWDI